ncbi:YraN family protein [Roseivirga pacifica]
MQSFGKRGEEFAKSFLSKVGYKLLAENYRAGRSEIDLICEKDGLLVFVEVKTRSSTAYGLPEDFVSKNQQQSIIRGAERYMEEVSWKGDLRFDILALVFDKGRFEVEHLKDAFY